MQSDEGDRGVQIAPMVDIVFVLMLFFMACAAMQSKAITLPAHLVGSHLGAARTFLALKSTTEGGVFLQDWLIGTPSDKKLGDLREWLKATKESFGTDDPLIIAPVSTVPHERVMDVLNAATVAEWPNVTFK